MEKRLQLHEELCDLLGSRNVYFQPPASVKLVYDCCIYKRRYQTAKADNRNYCKWDRWELLFIYRDPDQDIVQRCLEKFPRSSPGRPYTADNLYHWPVEIVY